MADGFVDDGRLWVPKLSTPGNPAAGAGFTFTPAETGEWRVVSLSFVLVNAAVAASRIPRVELLDPSGTVRGAVAAPFVTTTGVTSRFTFAVGITQFGANDAAQIGAPLAPWQLQDGLSLRVAITAVNAGDQVSGIGVYALLTASREDESGPTQHERLAQLASAAARGAGGAA